MSHANKYHDNNDNLALNHDSTSKLPSKSSQPPITTMAQAGLMDHDSRVYLAKKYRTQFAAAAGSSVAILAGVCGHIKHQKVQADADSQAVSSGEYQDANAIVRTTNNLDI